VIWQW